MKARKVRVARPGAVLYADERRTDTSRETIVWVQGGTACVVLTSETREAEELGRIVYEDLGALFTEIYAPTIHAYHACRALLFLTRRGIHISASPVQGLAGIVPILEFIGEIK